MQRLTQRAVKQIDFENAFFKKKTKRNKKQKQGKCVENATVGKY